MRGLLSLFFLFALCFAQSDIAATVSSVMDWSIDPCDDFWHFACGGWISNTTLPPTKPQLTRSFTQILDNNQEILKDIVEDKSHPKLNSFYSSCLDINSINQAGMTPITKLLTIIQLQSDLTTVVQLLHQQGIRAFFNFGPTIDPGNPSQVIGGMDQGGLGLPYPSLYLDDGSADLRKAYLDLIVNAFSLIGDQNPTQSAKDALELETSLATITVPDDALTDPFVTYNPMSYDDFKALSPQPFIWEVYFRLFGISTNNARLTVSVPTYFSNLTLVLPVLQDAWVPYLKWAVLRAKMPVLSQPFRDAYFKFYGTILGGQAQPEPLWRQCIAKTDALMGELTGKYFLQKAFPGTSQSSAVNDLKGILDSMKSDIINIQWMDPVTRTRALNKLSLVSNMIGGPASPRTYDNINITNNYYQNIQDLISDDIQRSMDTIGGPSSVVRNEWGMTPATVNAYYDPTRNQMVFPAGILQQPFFNYSFPLEMNLGGIGMVMGHELTHGFDNQGRLYDGTGRLVNWWQNATSAKFDQKVQCVIDQYSKFQPLPGVFINGKLTQGENIADMGGIKNAFATLKTMIGSDGLTSPSIVPKLNKGQLFFVGFAQTWCTVASPESIKLRIKTDPHSPAQFRVLGPLMNLPAFSQTYKCPAGSRMNPSDRCEVW